ncbi:hypothetical protein BGX38DRAFT_1274878 [Terfezia claveryi]|nr:hypothetical protein BGX38DRAFT_1274878 [Terfezia claveryi]
MAQKAAKQVARRNATSLNTLHVTSLCIHVYFIIYRLLLHRRSATTSTYTKYILFSLPALLIEAYLEQISRPKYAAGNAGDLRRAGEDLDAKGLMEYLWDIIYVTWGCLVGVTVFGEWVWWLWTVIPVYAVYTGISMFMGFRRNFGGLGSAGKTEAPQGMSNRQKKLEKRGGQRVVYG